MKKILFFINDLGQGGAEKVLVNLVNNMDAARFDITVLTLFSGGVNERFLKPHIHLKTVFRHSFRGNVHLMKLFSARSLHRMFIKEHYDVEVAYLEGASARVISGCTCGDTKRIAWIHSKQYPAAAASYAFRSRKEAEGCYNTFDEIACVSEDVKDYFQRALTLRVPLVVRYNTNESGKICEKAKEEPTDGRFSEKEVKLVGIGKLEKNKGFDRLIRITARLRREHWPVHAYILGNGSEEQALRSLISQEGAEAYVDLLGYQTNPYSYIARSDLFVCTSYSEGFSTAATEALIVGTPVCTMDVSGMKEMLGSGNEFGVVVENDEEALYRGLKQLLEDPALLAHYKQQAAVRGKAFSTEKTVAVVEEMLESERVR